MWKTIVKVTSSFHLFILFIYFFIPCADAFLFNLIVTLSSSHSHYYMFRLAENLRPYLYYLTDLITELYLLLQRQCIVDWVYWHSPKLLSSSSLVHVGIPHSSCGLYLSKHISWWTQISCTSSWMWRQNHNRLVYCKYLFLLDGS